MTERVHDKDFLLFLGDAREYCIFLERYSGNDSQYFLDKVYDLLVSLFFSARHLPTANLVSEKDLEISETAKEYEPVLKVINSCSPISFYRIVLNPLEMQNEVAIGTGDLIDDLFDIYVDLKRSIRLFEQGSIEYQEEAIWKFRSDFKHHWEKHCIDAIKIIREYSFG